MRADGLKTVIGASALLWSTSALSSPNMENEPIVIPNIDYSLQHSELDLSQPTARFKKSIDLPEPKINHSPKNIKEKIYDDYKREIVSLDIEAAKSEAEAFGDNPYDVLAQQVEFQLDAIDRQNNPSIDTVGTGAPAKNAYLKARESLERNDALNSPGFNYTFEWQDSENRDSITAVQYNGGSKSDSNTLLSLNTLWEEGSFAITKGYLTAEQHEEFVSHHEMYHFLENEKSIQDNGLPPTNVYGMHSSFVRELPADMNAVLQVEKKGYVSRDDYIDSLSLIRSYGAIMSDDGADHNSMSALQYLKDIPEGYFDNKTPKEIADYVMSLVENGDAELDIDPSFMLAQEFDRLNGMVKGDDLPRSSVDGPANINSSLKKKLSSGYQNTFNEELKHKVPTPLQIAEIVKKDPSLFSEANLEHLQVIIDLEHVIISQKDIDLGLVDKNDPRIAILKEVQANKQEVTKVKLDFIPNSLKIDPNHDDITEVFDIDGDLTKFEEYSLMNFYEEVKEHVFPEEINGEMMNDIPANARKGQLDSLKEAIANDTFTLAADIKPENANKVISFIEKRMKKLQSYKQKYGSLDSSGMQGEVTTHEKRSKQAFVKAYLDNVWDEKVEDRLSLHDKFSHQFDEGVDTPLPLDTTREEIQIFMEKSRISLEIFVHENKIQEIARMISNPMGQNQGSLEEGIEQTTAEKDDR